MTEPVTQRCSRPEAGDWDSAEQPARQATEAEDTDILAFLASMRKEAGDQESAERLLRQAADAGNAEPGTWWDISRVTERLWPHGLDPDGTPSRPW